MSERKFCCRLKHVTLSEALASGQLGGVKKANTGKSNFWERAEVLRTFEGMIQKKAEEQDKAHQKGNKCKNCMHHQKVNSEKIFVWCTLGGEFVYLEDGCGVFKEKIDVS